MNRGAEGRRLVGPHVLFALQDNRDMRCAHNEGGTVIIRPSHESVDGVFIS